MSTKRINKINGNRFIPRIQEGFRNIGKDHDEDSQGIQEKLIEGSLEAERGECCYVRPYGAH